MEVVREACESASEGWPVDVSRIMVVESVLPIVEGIILGNVFVDFVGIDMVLLFVT